MFLEAGSLHAITRMSILSEYVNCFMLILLDCHSLNCHYVCVTCWGYSFYTNKKYGKQSGKGESKGLNNIH